MKGTRTFERGVILENKRIAPDHHMMELALPAAFERAQPGQFVMIKIGRGETPLLARPFSVYGRHSFNGVERIQVLYRIAGKGTALLAKLKEGATLGVLGPLGHGFQFQQTYRKAALIAGGVGIAPLTFLGRYIRENRARGDCEVTGYLGARTESLLVGRRAMEEVCDTLRIATDDGSLGYHGVVTDLVENDLRLCEGTDTVMYACGPYPMLRAMAKLTEDPVRHCQVSMEERMACGLGACLGCAVKVKVGGTSPQYMRACTEGPVFDMQEIDWND